MNFLFKKGSWFHHSVVRVPCLGIDAYNVLFSGKKLPPDVDPLGVFANDEIDLVRLFVAAVVVTVVVAATAVVVVFAFLMGPEMTK